MAGGGVLGGWQDLLGNWGLELVLDAEVDGGEFKEVSGGPFELVLGSVKRLVFLADGGGLVLVEVEVFVGFLG